MQDAIDDDEEDGGTKEGIAVICGEHVREKESGMVGACCLWVRHYGNSPCEGMCCSLEAVGGRVAACMDDLTLTKDKQPVPRNRMLDACTYAWNSIEAYLKMF